MKNFRVALASFLLALAILFTACKKNSDEHDDTPAFGTCTAVAIKGNLLQTTSPGSFVYHTRGGSTITINDQSNIVITHDNYPGFKLEYWGEAGTASHPLNSAQHENLNGKHIKDKLGNRRTIIFPDGAKITMVAASEAGALISISIYEGGEAHHINANCNNQNVPEYSGVKESMAKQLDDAEADGETGTFEFTSTGLLYENIYTENTPGNKVGNLVPLGELEHDNPTKVNDLFDDPRLGST